MKRINKVLVLGCGRIGSAIARDLSTDHEVIVLDADQERLNRFHEEHHIRVITMDLTKADLLEKQIDDSDYVVSAVPGFMGFEILKRIIQRGKDVVDISFFNEDPFQLEELAREKGVCAIIDCGVAPGLSNIILGHHAGKEKLSSYACYVGGLPVKRTSPFEYKAPFSPIDVIAEYTRPARLVRNGKIEVLDALTERELIDFEGIGTLEAFNTDGLRSIVNTMQVSNMVEKTLRYPGHAQLMEAFREGGFFSEENIKFEGKDIRILDFTARILFDQWMQEEGEEEFTVMKIELKSQNGKYSYLILDRGDQMNNMSSMARLTGFTCTSALRFIEQNDVPKGLWPPELLAMNYKLFDFVIHSLKKKGVQIEIHEC